MTLLYITANPKSESESTTLQLGHTFIEEYKKNNPNDEVIELDLYKLDISALTNDQLNLMHDGQPNKMKQYAEQFKAADKYVFVAPMWNLNIPAKLHEYFDYITYSGTTFTYTENGPVGLLTDKKALHISSRGGIYKQGPGANFEMGDRYVRAILTFFGVESIETIALDGTNFHPEETLKQHRAQTEADLISMAQTF